MILAQFDKILENFTCFYGILGPFPCAKFSVRKFGCAKEFAFRRSDIFVFVFGFSCQPKYIHIYICHKHGNRIYLYFFVKNKNNKSDILFSNMRIILHTFTKSCNIYNKFARLYIQVNGVFLKT